MPFKSKAQQRYMFATMSETAKEWAHETPDIKGLPEKITTSDPAQTKRESQKRQKRQTQEKAASALSGLLEKMTFAPDEKAPVELPASMVAVLKNVEKQASIGGVLPSESSQNTGNAPQGRERLHGTRSILGGVILTPMAEKRARHGAQVLADTRLRAAYVREAGLRSAVLRFTSNPNNLGATQTGEKIAVALPSQVPTTTPLTQAQQAMTQFLPSKPALAGGGVPANGLDAPAAQAQQAPAPQPGLATAVPGMEGTAAANPIDMHGPLDPRGLAVDGNHAAGVTKGFKIAGWLREKRAKVYPLRAVTDDPEWQAERRASCQGCESVHSQGGGVCESCGARWRRTTVKHSCESSDSGGFGLSELSGAVQPQKQASQSSQSSQGSHTPESELWRASQLSQRIAQRTAQ